MGRYKFKVALIGDFGSGKSSLYRRLVEDRFDPDAANDSLECDFAELSLTVGGHSVKVSLWDTAGMEEHNNSMEGSYFRGLVGFLMVYDICTWKSYERIDFWKEQISSYAIDGVKMVLVGNKSDAPRKSRIVEEYEGKTLAATMRVPFYETSAKEGTNCRAALEALCQLVIDSDIPGVQEAGGLSSPSAVVAAASSSSSSPTVDLTSKPEGKKKCCPS